MYWNANKLRGQFWHALKGIVAEAEHDREVLALPVAKIGKASAHRLKVRCEARRLLGNEPSDGGKLDRPLRPRH